MMFVPLPGHEPARALRPSDVVPALRDVLIPLAKAMKAFLRGEKFDGDRRYAESREIESFHLERAVEAARNELRTWVGIPRVGFGPYPQCLRAVDRAAVLLLTSEPFGRGHFKELPVISLATTENLNEVSEILEDLDTWQGETPEHEPTKPKDTPAVELPDLVTGDAAPAGPAAPQTGERNTTREAPADPVEATVKTLGKAVRQIELVKFLAPRENRSGELTTVAKNVYKRQRLDKQTLKIVRRQVEQARENLGRKVCPLQLHISGNVVRLIDADPVA